MIDEAAIEAAAQQLHALQREGQRGPRLAVDLRPREPIDGWRIQRRVSALRGEPVRGWKCALPPADRWIAAALHEAQPNDSRLPAPADARGLARIEPEFAFELKHALPTRGAAYAFDEVDAAIGSVRPAVEVLGCRYHDDEAAAASGPELMADSLWHHSLVLGPPVEKQPLNRAFELGINVQGEPTATSLACHPDGDPRRPLRWLAEFLRCQGIGLAATDIVITGSLAGVIELPFGRRTVLGFGWFGEVALTLDPLLPHDPL